MRTHNPKKGKEHDERRIFYELAKDVTCLTLAMKHLIKRIRKFFRSHDWDYDNLRWGMAGSLPIPMSMPVCKKCGDVRIYYCGMNIGLICFLANHGCKRTK